MSNLEIYPVPLEDVDAAERLGVPELKRRIKQLEANLLCAEEEVEDLESHSSRIDDLCGPVRRLLHALDDFPELQEPADASDLQDLLRRRKLRHAVQAAWTALDEV